MGGDDESPLFCAKNYKKYGEEGWLNRGEVDCAENGVNWMSANYVTCRACGAQIMELAEICPKCGVRQKAPPVTVVTFEKSRVLFALLQIFLGPLGIHSFYVGRNWNGIINLIVAFGIGWLGFIAVQWAAHLIAGIIWLLRSDEAFQQEFLKK
jgi:TM2 domain-containing membrane protein YozV